MPPAASWLDDARIALSIVVSFEESADLAVAGGDERNEKAYEIIEEVRDAATITAVLNHPQPSDSFTCTAPLPLGAGPAPAAPSVTSAA